MEWGARATQREMAGARLAGLGIRSEEPLGMAGWVGGVWAQPPKRWCSSAGMILFRGD